MKRSTKFIIGFSAAILTYGALFASMGPRHFGQHHWRSKWNQHCHYDDQAKDNNCHHQSITPDNVENKGVK